MARPSKGGWHDLHFPCSKPLILSVQNSSDSKGEGGDARCQCTSHVVSFVNRGRSISVEGKSRSIFVGRQSVSYRINGAFTKDKSAAIDTIRVDEGGNKKVTDFEEILLRKAGGVRKTLEVEED